MRRPSLPKLARLAALTSSILLLAACGTADSGDAAGVVVNEVETVEVTDSAGRDLTIPLPIERVAVLDSGTPVILRALGALDLLVGNHEALVGDPLWEDIADVPAVATHSEISFEALAEVQPDLALSSIRAHGVVTDNELLSGFDIADVKVSLRRPELMKDEILMLGHLFDAEDVAQELVDFYTRIEGEIADRIADVPEEDRPTVFVEYHAGDFNTGGPGSRFYEQIPLAGGQNIAAEIDDEAQVSAEWVAEHNPDVIIREGAALGYGVESTDEARNLRDEVAGRAALGSTTAVAEGNVYVLPTDGYSRPAYIIGVAHIARWLYPDRFDDGFVRQVVDEFTDLFHPGVNPAPGIWGYPEARSG